MKIDRHPGLALKLIFLAAFILAQTACKTPRQQQPGSDVKEIINQNLIGASFGLEAGEFVLTIDDGPTAHTERLVNYLIQENIPATFFLIGANVNAGTRPVLEKMKSRPDLFIIGNHSMSHSPTPLTSSGSFALTEIKDADAVIKEFVDPAHYFFFRPPYGALVTSSGSVVTTINTDSTLKKYIGPVFWNVGGAISGGFAADWDCWARGWAIPDCQAGYMNEMNTRTRGVVLLHDATRKTVDMLIGGDGRVGLIQQMKNSGYKIVRLDKRGEALGLEFNAYRATVQPTSYDLEITHRNLGQGNVRFMLSVRGADTIKVTVASSASAPGLSWEFRQDSVDFTQAFLNGSNGPASGNYIMNVEAFKNGGRVLQEPYLFTVAADFNQNAGCLNMANLTAGKKFDIRHGLPGKPPLNGVLTLAREPMQVDANTVELTFNLQYPGHTEISEVLVRVDAQTGQIESGVRHKWSINSNVTWTIKTSQVQCNSYPKLWKGEIILNKTPPVVEVFELIVNQPAPRAVQPI